jgi:DNA-binding ferritin-like protein (Dps family)
MNSDRTQAYGRIVKTLEDLGPAKLLATEQVRIRDAADTLIFASAGDHDVMAEVEDDVRALADHLVDSGRWTEERAAKLVDDLGACGPLAPVA